MTRPKNDEQGYPAREQIIMHSNCENTYKLKGLGYSHVFLYYVW